MRRSLLLAGLTAASLVALVANSGAQQRMARVGVLECRGGASVGFIVGSVTHLGCVLRAGHADGRCQRGDRRSDEDERTTHEVISE